jgi:hypothetical protein
MSYAAYSAKFWTLVSKVKWDNNTLIEYYYRGLKEEVKDKLYREDRLDDLIIYIIIVIKIDK